MGNAKSAVIVVSGVNGVGKTTSIGKLGKYFKDNNRSVVFGAADTFRAAAIDQLQVWAAKVKVDIIKSEINSDPASVAFKTAEFAKKNEIDVALIDTAGRLQNKKNLMGIIDETNEARGLQIFIGSENNLFGLTGCTTIISPFKNKEKEIIGAIGVIGPMRLNYAKIIPVVDYTANVIGKKFQIT